MKTLHTYLTRQIVGSLFMTVAVFTFVLLLANALKEILPLLVNGQVSFGVVAEAIGLLVPFVWVFALPMGMLTATLLIFGRFSADQELTAVRASGISLVSLITPILLLSLALCGISALVNMEIGPRCRVAYTGILDRLKLEFSSAQLPEGRHIKDYPGYIFYVGKNNKGILEDVMVFHLTNEEATVRAPRGKLEVDGANKRLNLILYDSKSVILRDGKRVPGPAGDWTLPIDLQPARPQHPKITDMTFLELWDELHDLEARLNVGNSLQHFTPEQMKTLKAELRKERSDLTSPIRVQIHRQVAFSFACFGFTLLGIPLGIRVHRRETNVGIAMALLLVSVYYSFILLGQALDMHPEWSPHLIMWIPNLIFQVLGTVLLWRANRGV